MVRADIYIVSGLTEKSILTPLNMTSCKLFLVALYQFEELNYLPHSPRVFVINVFICQVPFLLFK